MVLSIKHLLPQINTRHKTKSPPFAKNQETSNKNTCREHRPEGPLGEPMFTLVTKQKDNHPQASRETCAPNSSLHIL